MATQSIFKSGSICCGATSFTAGHQSAVKRPHLRPNIGSEVLSRVMGSYEQLDGERSFAEKTYQHALEALDRARLNADRQQVYIAGFVQPSLPEEALYPRRGRSIALIFVLCGAVWLTGAFLVHTVREHL